MRTGLAELLAGERPILADGSMGPTGAILAPLGELSFAAARAAFAEQVAALAEGGVDAFWIETMYDLEEVRAAVEAAREAAPELPIVTTMTFDTAGHTMMGTSPDVAADALQDMGVFALGGNCGNGPAEIERALSGMRPKERDPFIVAKSNAGVPHLEGSATVYDATPEDMAKHVQTARALGAQIIGGCCGNTPNHIRAMAVALGIEALGR